MIKWWKGERRGQNSSLILVLGCDEHEASGNNRDIRTEQRRREKQNDKLGLKRKKAGKVCSESDNSQHSYNALMCFVHFSHVIGCCAMRINKCTYTNQHPMHTHFRNMNFFVYHLAFRLFLCKFQSGCYLPQRFFIHVFFVIFGDWTQKMEMCFSRDAFL